MKKLIIVLMMFGFVGIAQGEGLERFSPEWHNSAERYRDGEIQWAVFPDGHIEAWFILDYDIIEITGERLKRIEINYERDKDIPQSERKHIER